MLIVAKPVSWTLDPDRLRKTGNRYNDTLSCFGKPKGYVTMSQKVTVLFHCYLVIFGYNCTGGIFTAPPVARRKVNIVSWGETFKILRVILNVLNKCFVSHTRGSVRQPWEYHMVDRITFCVDCVFGQAAKCPIIINQGN